MCLSSYCKVSIIDAVEQRYMVNSGVRGIVQYEGQEPQDRGVLVHYSNTSIVPIIYPITCKCRVPVI